ncbi:MAG: Hsp20/alpha crystallin family protein [Candidatus Freyarchaeota archaeon]
MFWEREPEDEFERWMHRMMKRFWERYPKHFAFEFPPFGRVSFEPPTPEVRSMYADIQETDKEIIIVAELPGVKKEDININATENRVEISAEVKVDREETEEGREYIYRERTHKKFYRSFKLPVQVIPEKAAATYKNGILELKLPKRETREKRPIKID